MVRHLLLVAFLSAACTTLAIASTVGDENGQREKTELASATFIDPQALAIARLNLTRIDVDALDRALQSELAAIKPPQFVQGMWERNVRHLGIRLKRLKELNVAEIYLVLTLYELQTQMNRLAREPERFIYAVVPMQAGIDAMEVATVFAQDPPGQGKTRTMTAPAGVRGVSRGGDAIESAWFSLHFHSAMHVQDAAHGNIVLAGPPQLLEYLAKANHDERASLNAAFNAAGEGAFQLVVSPPPVFARAAEEVLGPVKVGEGISLGQTMSRGFQWGAFTLRVNNGDLSARLVIQSRDAAAAEVMKQLVDIGLKAVRESDGSEHAGLAQMAKLIDLQVTEQQLHWQIGANHTPSAKVLEALRPALLAQQIRLGTHQSMNNLKQIGLALHNFYAAYRAFPTPGSYDKDGKPLLSWRVHVMAYMPSPAEQQLYREFRLDEPWDSPHNKKLIERMPAIYRRPFADPKVTSTPYLAPIGEKTAFRQGKKMEIRDIRDGTSKTIGIVEVDPAHEVIWTKPDDWEVDWNDPTKGLTDGAGTSFIACFLDNSVRQLPKSIDKEVLRRFLMADDGYPVHHPDTFAE